MSSNLQHDIISSNYIRKVNLRWLLLLSGNVEENPGPPKTRKQSEKSPMENVGCDEICGKEECNDKVEDNCVECVVCQKWFHAECVDLSEDEIDALGNKRIRWFCDICEPDGDELQCITKKRDVSETDRLDNENKLLKQKLAEGEEKVKNHQVLENELLKKNLDMAGRIAALESELKSSSNQGEDDLLKEKVKTLELEIEHHKKIGEELIKADKGKADKEQIKQSKNEISALKKQVGNLETENRKVKAELDGVKTDVETHKLEVKREKDINDILIKQVKQINHQDDGRPPVTRSPSRESHDRSIQIEGEYVQVDPISGSEHEADFCREEFASGRGKCSNPDCKENHDIDFSKKGVCVYEYQKEGSCRKGRQCWFLHQIPKWYRRSDEIATEMRLKIQRMKERPRVINNKTASPPVWQSEMKNAVLTAPSGLQLGSKETPYMSMYKKSNQRNPSSDDFLEILTKLVEQQMKNHSDID